MITYGIHKRVKDYMEKHDLRPSEMSRRLGITRQAFSWLMNKGQKNIGLEVVDAMDILDSDTDEWA